MKEEANKNKAQKTDEQPHDDLLFRVTPAGLGSFLQYATEKPIDFSWVESLAGNIEAARTADFSWLEKMARQIPPHEEMMRFAEAIAARAQEAVAGLEMLSELIRASATAEYKSFSSPAIASQVVAAMQMMKGSHHNDDPQIIEGPDVEM
jgi:hypothetical protein